MSTYDPELVRLLSRLRLVSRPETELDAGELALIRDVVAKVQRDGGLAVTGELDPRTVAAVRERVEAAEAQTSRIDGRALTADGRPCPELPIRAYRLDLGGVHSLVAETATDADGGFRLQTEMTAAMTIQLRVIVDGEERPVTGWFPLR